VIYTNEAMVAGSFGKSSRQPPPWHWVCRRLVEWVMDFAIDVITNIIRVVVHCNIGNADNVVVVVGIHGLLRTANVDTASSTIAIPFNHRLLSITFPYGTGVCPALLDTLVDLNYFLYKLAEAQTHKLCWHKLSF
jgi:hypothetical protein